MGRDDPAPTFGLNWWKNGEMYNDGAGMKNDGAYKWWGATTTPLRMAMRFRFHT